MRVNILSFYQSSDAPEQGLYGRGLTGVRVAGIHLLKVGTQVNHPHNLGTSPQLSNKELPCQLC